MTDMPEWRAWADAAHRDSLRKPRSTKGSRNTRFRCSSPTCKGRTTKNQAKINGDVCIHCRSPLAYVKGRHPGKNVA